MDTERAKSYLKDYVERITEKMIEPIKHHNRPKQPSGERCHGFRTMEHTADKEKERHMKLIDEGTQHLIW